MSKRNNQQEKTAARERLRAERERQAKKEARNRQFKVGGGVLAVLVIAGGVVFGVSQAGGGDSGSSDQWASAKKDPLVKPENASGKDGTTVVVGKAGAKKTLQMYEDPRCPVCAQFEQTVGSTVDKGVEDGTYKVQYIGATFLDGNLGGSGSKNALSALGAALDVSPDAFWHYKAAMYTKENHPDEQKDTFNSDAALIKIADQVPELKGDKAFQKDVKDGTFDKWALTMSEKFDKSGVQGTPTLQMDGKKLTSPGSDNAPMTVADFTNALNPLLKG